MGLFELFLDFERVLFCCWHDRHIWACIHPQKYQLQQQQQQQQQSRCFDKNNTQIGRVINEPVLHFINTC
jgi:hypothetical protein